MPTKQPRAKKKSYEELKAIYGERPRRSIGFDEAINKMGGEIFGDGCSCDQEEDVELEPWLIDKIKKLGLYDEWFYAACVGGDSVLKFIHLNGLTDGGGYTDSRKKSLTDTA